MVELDPNRDSAIQLAERELNEALHQVECVEEELLRARREATLAQGRLYLATHKPTRSQVLNPGVEHTAAMLYTYCMQLGYQFAVFNGTVHYVGSPSEQLVNTGKKLEGLPA